MNRAADSDISSARELLQSVQAYERATDNAKARLAGRFAPDFNIFDHLRRDEMGVSGVIAFLLDPNGNHGQHHTFLSLFCQQFAEEFDKHVSSETWKASTERQANGQRRIDICLESENSILAIENKPWAEDQEDQLLDYANYLERQNKKKWKLLYLSRSEPTVFSIPAAEREKLEQENLLLCTTFEAVENWLHRCAQACMAPNIRMFIEHFTDFVRVNINNRLSMLETQEMVASILLKDNASIESAFLVSSALDEMKRKLLGDLHAALDTGFRSHGFLLEWDHRFELGDWKSNCGFSVRLGGDKDDMYLRFEFNGPRLSVPFWGIVHSGKGDRNQSEPRQDSKGSPRWTEVRKIMDKAFPNGRDYSGWPWYTYSGVGELERCMGGKDLSWDKEPLPWIRIKDGTLPEAFVNRAVDVHRLFIENNALELLHPDQLEPFTERR